jgi:hypothetical protein
MDRLRRELSGLLLEPLLRRGLGIFFRPESADEFHLNNLRRSVRKAFPVFALSISDPFLSQLTYKPLIKLHTYIRNVGARGSVVG